MRFPIKTVQAIIDEAWKSAASIDEQWDLYHSLAVAGPVLHEIVVLAITHFPICFRVGPSHKDIELCKLVVDQVIAFAQARGDRVNEPFQKPLSPPHITLDLAGFNEMRFAVWPAYMYMSALCTAFPDCPSITVFSPSPLSIDHVAGPLFRTLARFPLLTRVYLDFKWSEIGYPRLPLGSTNFGIDPNFTLPKVRFLRLQTYTLCTCEPWYGHKLQHGCPLVDFLHVFPRVVHLHLDTPSSLTRIHPPTFLEILTLEAPPLPHITGTRWPTTIMAYDLKAALSRWTRTCPYLQSVVVRTGEGIVFGFKQAEDACREYGIKLVKEVVYA